MKFLQNLKKIIPGIILVLSMSSIAYSQSPNWVWGHNSSWIGGIGGAVGATTDNNGNVIAVGDFASSSITFGSHVLSNCSWNSNSTIYTVKYDKNGNVLWAKTACGYFDYIYPTKIASDNAGNIWVTGYFSGDSIVFGNTTLLNPPTVGLYDNMFIVKYDPNGNLLFAKTASTDNSNGSCHLNCVSIDTFGNAYVAGMFSSNTLILDQDTLRILTLNSSPFHDIFIVKYNPNGNIIWTKVVGGFKDDIVNEILVDKNNVYITGYFASDSIQFSGKTIYNHCLNSLGNNLFIANFSATGNIKWAKSNYAQGGSTGIRMAWGTSHNQIYLTGNFDGPYIKFDNDSLAGTQSFFITSFDSMGTYFFAKGVKGRDCKVTDCASDASGNLYILGYYNEQYLNFDSTVLMNYNYGHLDIFIAKYSPALKVIWAKSIGMTKDDIGKGIATINNDVFITGTFRSPILNLGSINLYVSTAPFGIGDIFVAKLSGNCSSVSITQQSMTPSNAQIGSSILLDVIATGTPPISYQWYVNNYPISGANSSSYTTQAVTASQQGIFYNCSVSNCSYSNTFYTNNDSVLIKFPEGIGNSSIYNLGDNLLIYPNPSEKKIKIDCPKEINQIKVIDMIGHLVNHSLISGKSTSISIEKAGTYIMEISTNEGVFYRKIQITSN